MRLINTTTLELEDFTLREIPQYAILSHTWGEDEVTFQDMNSRDLPRYFKPGYVKIVETCRLASEHGLQYAWIDACCIDKSNSAELTEAINSMFTYYGRSKVCIAHLADLDAGATEIGSCRWFTRGWTLQELLAPRVLKFYDCTWSYIGSKSDYVGPINRATNIASAALRDASRIKDYSLTTRLSWASDRQTTRLEDTAYCLLGLFNVNMPLIYGEGIKSFQRLLEEIIKQNNDLTILAWRPSGVSMADLQEGPGMSLLPQGPSAFRRSDNVFPLASDFPELSMTNRGLLVSPDIPWRVLSPSSSPENQFCAIQLGYTPGNPPAAVYLPLRKMGPGLFCRHRHIPLISSNDIPVINDFWQENTLNYHIITHTIPRSLENFHSFRDHAIHVPHLAGAELMYAVPDRLWDPEDRMFLRPQAIRDTYFPVVLALSFKTTTGDNVLVLCDNSTGVPSAAIVSDASSNTVMRLLFRGKHREQSLIWADFEALGVEVKFGRNNGLDRDTAGHRLVLEQGTSQAGFPPVQVSLHARTSGRVR